LFRFTKEQYLKWKRGEFKEEKIKMNKREVDLIHIKLNKKSNGGKTNGKNNHKKDYKRLCS